MTKQKRRYPFLLACLVAAVLLNSLSVSAQFDQARVEEDVERISGQVAKIRGLDFKRPIGVANQSIEDFEDYLDRELDSQIPPALADNFDGIVRKLGLYRGPVIDDFKGMAKLLMTSQAAAYYDPKEHMFYVLMTDTSNIMMKTIYAHELYHGLQDQHFGLDDYYIRHEREGTLTDDEMMARQAVVEGEATLMMMMWMMQYGVGAAGGTDTNALRMVVDMQRNMTTEQLKQSVAQQQAMGIELDDMQKSIQAMNELPRFLIETLVGAYLKGMGFVFDVYERDGWRGVERLFESDPPESTEQILHVEKWFSGERPVRFDWPELESEPTLAGWEPLDVNTLGEIQWQIVFEEYGLGRRAKGAAAGWGGDTYAVFKRTGSDDLLLLSYTAWDTEWDAMQFIDAYEELLPIKYPNGSEQHIIERGGTDVIIVEGGTGDETEAFLDVLKKVRRR